MTQATASTGTEMGLGGEAGGGYLLGGGGEGAYPEVWQM